MHNSFVKPFPMLFIKIQSTETLYLTCFYNESTYVYSASLLSLEVKVKFEKSLRVPNSPLVYTTGETVLDKFTGCEVVFMAGKNTALVGRRHYTFTAKL